MAEGTRCPFSSAFLSFGPWLMITGFLLSLIYPHLGGVRKDSGVGLKQAAPDSVGRRGLWAERCRGRHCHSRTCERHVVSSHFQPNICFINIKWKCFWLLRKHYYKMCKYNDRILSTVYKIASMENRHLCICFLSYASVIGNENINPHGMIKIKFTASSWH